MDNQQGFPGSLTEIPTGLSRDELDLVPGEGFWARIEQIALKGEMTRGLDAAMKGKASPRIWLFLHERGRGELSTAAAMSFARELAFRDQAALLLDCDDRDQALTRWAGRVQAEGWIDLARYGTSVLTSGVAMPFVGRRGYLLGVGSFAPTDVTEKEIDILLTRLRRQGDDLLLVAPADALGRLWAPAAGIRIFCWDKKTMTEEAAGAVAAEFSAAGCPLTAVATFREAAAAGELLVDQVLSEVESDPIPAEPEKPAEPKSDEPSFAVDAPDAPDAPDEEAGPGHGDDEQDIAAPEEAGWENLPLEQGTESAEPDPGGADWEEPLPQPTPEPRRETSRVFWFGALTAVVLIAVITAYYFKFVRVPPDGHFEQIDVVSQTTIPPADQEVQALENGNPDIAAGMAAVTDSVAASLEGTPDSTATPEMIAQVEGTSLDTLQAAVPPPPEAEVKEEEPQEKPAPLPSGFDMGPYQKDVGAKGWALHVYSLPDSAATVKQLKELSRRGFRSEVRIIDLGEKGRWRRIYLGSFSTRTEAKEAMPALLKKLREDWAKPERF